MGSKMARMRTARDTNFLVGVERALKSMSIVDHPMGSGTLRFLFEQLKGSDEALLHVIEAEPRKGLAMNDLQTDIWIVPSRARETPTVRPAVRERPLPVERLLSIAKSIRVLTSLHLGRIGLNAGQDQFLDILGEEEHLTVSNMAVRLNVRPSTVSKMADRLSGKGLVERLEDEADARRTRLRLTEAGRDMRDDVRHLWRHIQTDLGRAGAWIGDAEIDGVLETIETALRRRLSRLR